jgi:hypothetical protein
MATPISPRNYVIISRTVDNCYENLSSTNIAIFEAAVILDRNRSGATAYDEGVPQPYKGGPATVVDGNCTVTGVFSLVPLVLWELVNGVLGVVGRVYAPLKIIIQSGDGLKFLIVGKLQF